MKRLILALFLLAPSFSLSCPTGQHEECILPRPWGGCAQKICVPNMKNPFEELQRIIENKALEIAIDGKTSEKIKNREDCMVIVTAGLTVWGAAQSGAIGALVGGSAGAAAASLSCRQVFPL